MSRADRIAEEAKLRRVLGAPGDPLTDFEGLDFRALRQVREAISDALFANTRPTLERVAASSKLLPAALVAKLGQRSMGPMLCARITALLAPERAAAIAAHMETSFLAEVALELDPRSAGDVIARLDVARVVEIALLLSERSEFVTMGRLVDALSLDAIAAVVARLRDDGALLQIAFYIENKSVLGDLAGLMGIERIRNMVRFAGSGDGERWVAAISLMEHLDAGWRERIGELVVAEGDGFLAGLVGAASAHDLWDALLPITASMSDSAKAAVMQSEQLSNSDVMARVIDAADRAGLWAPLVALVPLLDARATRVAAEIIAQLPVEAQRRLLLAVDEAGVFEALRASLGLVRA